MLRRLLALILLLMPCAALAQGQPDTAALIADQVRVEGQDRLVAEGAVEVLYGTRRLRARRITYDQTNGRLLIEGPITLVDGADILVLASAAELDADLRNGILRSARVVLAQQLQLAAAQVRRVGDRYTELDKTVASSCQVCASNPVPLWSIRAERVIHDQQEQQIYFENATFRVMDVPVFWLPQMRLPDPTLTRTRGFLVPDIRSTSQLGTGVKVPYFIPIGRSRDVTLTPYVSNHTRTLEGRYRQAFRHGTISFEGAVSRDDVVAQDARAYLFGEGSFELPHDYKLSFGLELTSDPAYLLDYGYSDADRLRSFLRVEKVRRNELILGRIINFRTLRESEIPIEDTLPYLLGAAEWEKRFPGIGGGEAHVGLSLQGHQRTSDTDVAGRDVLRFGAEAGWTGRWVLGPGIETTAEAQMNADAWMIGQDSSYPSDLSRLTPAAAVTLRWPWAGRLGGSTSVIEPIAQVAWSDVWGSVAPPNEDSTLAEFDEGNLLSLNRFPGSDRRETGLRGVLGMNWHLYGGGWSLGTAVGRVWRDAAEPDFTAASGLDGSASDWLVGLNVGLGTRLAFASRTLVDDDLTVAKSESRLSWSGDRLFLAASYIWVIADPLEGRPDQTNEFNFDTSFDFTRHWTGSAEMRYDVDADRAASAGVGMVYRNECVSVDLSLSRRFTSSTSVEPTTDVGLTVALNGFGRDGRAYRRTCGG